MAKPPQAPLCDQAAVDVQATDWASLWEVNLPYRDPAHAHAPCPPPDALLPNAITVAAQSFPSNTAVGADNISPGAVARLSLDALRALSILLLAFETLGIWCPALDLVLIVLLPKSAGGFRAAAHLHVTPARPLVQRRCAAVR